MSFWLAYRSSGARMRSLCARVDVAILYGAFFGLVGAHPDRRGLAALCTRMRRYAFEVCPWSWDYRSVIYVHSPLACVWSRSSCRAATCARIRRQKAGGNFVVLGGFVADASIMCVHERACTLRGSRVGRSWVWSGVGACTLALPTITCLLGTAPTPASRQYTMLDLCHLGLGYVPALKLASLNAEQG